MCDHGTQQISYITVSQGQLGSLSLRYEGVTLDAALMYRTVCTFLISL